MKKNILVTGVVIVAVFLLLTGCGSKPVDRQLTRQETAPTPEVTPILMTETMPILLAKSFAAENSSLIATLANLNRAELKFIQDAAQGSTNLDSDLTEVSNYSMQLASSAEKLANTMSVQDETRNASLLASKEYLEIAKIAYALVIDTQNIRQGLQQNSIAISSATPVIAEYGARLWTPELKEFAEANKAFTANVIDPTSIEAPQFLSVETAKTLNVELSKHGQPESWLAVSNETVVKTLTVPREYADPILETAVQKLIEITSAELSKSDNQKTLTVTLTKAGSISDLQAITDLTQSIERAFPTFANGLSGVVNRSIQNEIEHQISLSVMQLTGIKPPIISDTVQIIRTKSIVNLKMSVIDIGQRSFQGNFGQETAPLITFSISWTSDLVNPKFRLNCFSIGKVRDQTRLIQAASGEDSMTLEGTSPQTKIVCAAFASYSDNKYGSASITVATPEKDVETQEVIEPPVTTTTTPVEPETTPPTSPAPSPVVYIKASFVETVTAGSAVNFSTAVDLTANFDQKTITGNITGRSGRYVEFICYDKGKAKIDYATVGYDFSYVTFVNGQLDPTTGAFSAQIEPDGKITGELTSPFIKSMCTHMNNDPIPGLDPFSGKGTISGVINRDGTSSISTNWTAGKAAVRGSWSGVVTK